jgi:hypothetical protein
LLPVNIYYHFYAGERRGGVKALKALYAWAEAQPLAPIRTSRYARIVEGFHAGRIEAVAPDTWRVLDNGACRTLRFDGEDRQPDLSRSRGVAGFNRTAGALYVHLAPGPATVVLAAQPPPQPYLVEANAPLGDWTPRDRGFAATFEAAVPVLVRLAGFAPGQAVRLGGDWHDRVEADAAGRLSLQGPQGLRRLEVTW